MPRNALDITYAQLMRIHPFGMALYCPLPLSQFHAGSIGYFDSAGSWNSIGDVSGSPQLPPVLTAIETSQLVRAPTEQYIWGPKLGQNTRATEISLDAGLGEIPMLAVTGGTAPIDISACWEFQSAGKSGSILLTTGPVFHERYYHKTPFLNWMKLNAKSLVSACPEVKEHGAWVVTSTWAATEASVNCWKDSTKSVKVGFGLKAIEIGEVAPMGSWCHGNAAAGWITTHNQGGESSVVFFHGIHFTYIPILGLTEVNIPREFRGSDATVSESLTTFENSSSDSSIAAFEVVFEDNFEEIETQFDDEDDDANSWEVAEDD